MKVWRWVEMPVVSGSEEEVRRALLRQASVVRAFPGCLFLRLFCAEGPTFYSLSLWESVEALEEYRRSEAFRQFWKQMRLHFRGAPRAVNLTRVEEEDEQSGESAYL
ncbi:MAG: antibiotic biosynthesis monooxygenase family protein [Bacteroidia bacterium]|nr:antibiotic biosynthesis monooxygenase [Bacteroidia bacterium]MDW8015707.1 antibiotic biosynthesis monooxygenase family protein [Bacteroidia bacterium]